MVLSFYVSNQEAICSVHRRCIGARVSPIPACHSCTRVQTNTRQTCKSVPYGTVSSFSLWWAHPAASPIAHRSHGSPHSLIDIAMMVTGKNDKYAAQHIERVKERYREVSANKCMQKEEPVLDAETSRPSCRGQYYRREQSLAPHSSHHPRCNDFFPTSRATQGIARGATRPPLPP